MPVLCRTASLDPSSSHRNTGLPIGPRATLPPCLAARLWPRVTLRCRRFRLRRCRDRLEMHRHRFCEPRGPSCGPCAPCDRVTHAARLSRRAWPHITSVDASWGFAARICCSASPCGHGLRVRNACVACRAMPHATLLPLSLRLCPSAPASPLHDAA